MSACFLRQSEWSSMHTRGLRGLFVLCPDAALLGQYFTCVQRLQTTEQLDPHSILNGDNPCKQPYFRQPSDNQT
eukprot:scaffold14186_cov38-Prasinocladus_malaysianus.AAC.1